MGGIRGELLTKLRAGEMSDLIITCGTESFLVHKAIVCNRSQFFKAACVNNTTESLTSVVDLPEDDPILVEKMIDFLYSGRYSSQNLFEHLYCAGGRKTPDPSVAKASIQMGSDSKQGILHDGEIHVRLKSIAKKYVLSDLAAYVDRKFLEYLEGSLSTVSFWTCASLVYSSTQLSDAKLRRHVVSKLGYHMETAAELESVKPALRKIPELAIDFTWYTLRLASPHLPSYVSSEGDSSMTD